MPSMMCGECGGGMGFLLCLLECLHPQEESSEWERWGSWWDNLQGLAVDLVTISKC